MASVMTTVFSTHCLKSSGARLVLVLGLWLALAAGVGAAQGVQLSELRVQRDDDGLYLSAQVHLELGPVVEEAMDKAIPVHFVADAQIVRERWYWSDEKLSDEKRYFRVAFQPLTRRWRLNTSNQPILDSGLGVSYSQFYDSLGEALSAVGRISRWKIADAAELEPGSRQMLRFRFRLDASQLPRALQIGASGQSDWAMGVERKIDLTHEVGR